MRKISTMSVMAMTWLTLGAAMPSAADARHLFFKSPGPGMHFTAGLTVQVWGDLIPRDEAPGWPQVECRWDDQMVEKRVGGNPKGYDYYPFTVPAAMVTPGVHKLKLSGFDRGGGLSTPPEVTMPVQIDPWPADKQVVELKEDLTAADLDWTNVAVKGNGHAVKVSGKLTIKNSLITGLGSVNLADPADVDPGKVVMVPGITGTLTGAVDIEDSIFEATGSVVLRINGSGAVAIKNNEFRASNYIKFVPYNPDASAVIEFAGDNATPKVFQGNRVGAGIVKFERMSNWLIGGAADAQSNIMIGPRCVLSIAGCRDVQVVGNYIFHNYRGQWSQGFNLICGGSTGVLAEHNVLRASSWPLQSFSGEFRYNLMVDSGHNWVRTLITGTKFHHNVLVHTGDPFGSGIDAGIWLYKDAKDVAVYNNTFDAGAAPEFGAPIIALSAGCSLSTLRNNVFTGVRPITSIARNAIVARRKNDPDSGTRVAYADYNCFSNPDAPTAANYDPGIVEKQDAGAHDVKGDPRFAKGRMIPYAINEDDVWNRKLKVSQVLGLYRERYAPAADSPLLGAGDPADGKNSFIGAIGPGQDAKDLFGRFSAPAEGKAGK